MVDVMVGGRNGVLVAVAVGGSGVLVAVAVAVGGMGVLVAVAVAVGGSGVLVLVAVAVAGIAVLVAVAVGAAGVLVGAIALAFNVTCKSYICTSSVPVPKTRMYFAPAVPRAMLLRVSARPAPLSLAVVRMVVPLLSSTSTPRFCNVCELIVLLIGIPIASVGQVRFIVIVASG